MLQRCSALKWHLAFGARGNEEERAIRPSRAGSTSDIFRYSAGRRTSRAQEAADKEKEDADEEALRN
jgi:hypothetical protein